MIELLITLLGTAIVAHTLDILSSMKLGSLGFKESNVFMRKKDGTPSLLKMLLIKGGFIGLSLISLTDLGDKDLVLVACILLAVLTATGSIGAIKNYKLLAKQ